MTLLDRAGREQILVFPEESYVDSDGNLMLRPSEVGIPATATIHPLPQSGTSARRVEQDNEGYESEQVYSLRFPRSSPFHSGMGMVSQIEWHGQRWSVFGHSLNYNGSRRTWHSDYRIQRT